MHKNCDTNAQNLTKKKMVEESTLSQTTADRIERFSRDCTTHHATTQLLKTIGANSFLLCKPQEPIFSTTALHSTSN